jgi:GNAT superfamily N-acetyltransferase
MDTDSSEHESHTPRSDPFEGIPPLSTSIATEEQDIVDALKLVADSVAQQRQTASRILIFHPLNVTVFTVVMALMVQWLYKSRSDIPLLLTTSAGVTMTALVAVKWVTGDYLFLAENINWAWLGDDQVYITKFGDEVIGTCIVGWEKGEGRGNRRKKWGKGVVRAWSVRLRYRGKGVGSALLEEAVKGVEKKGGDELVFADDHASKLTVSPLKKRD